MATTISDAGTDKVFARVSAELKAEIDKRAEALGQKSGEWIRATLATAIEADRRETETRDESTDQLVTLIEGRFDRLEERIFDESTVILKLGFEILLDLARTHAAALAAAVSTEDLLPDEIDEKRRHLINEGNVDFNSRKDEIFPVLKQMRDEAEKKAKNTVILPNGHDGSS